jgi:hypothetical protein
MRKLCALVSVVSIPQATAVAQTSVNSDRSVRTMCEDQKMMDEWCRHYVRAVVETWMLKDARGLIEGQTPKDTVYLYDSANNTPKFCERLLNYHPDEWVAVVRSNPLETGFGPVSIMKVLHKAFCR